MAHPITLGNCTTITTNTGSDQGYIYYSSADGKIMSSSSSVTFKAPIPKMHFDVFEDEDTWWMTHMASYGYLTDEEQIEVTDLIDEPDLMSAFDWLKTYYAAEIVKRPHLLVERNQSVEVYVTIDGEELNEVVYWGDIVDAYNGKNISKDQESCEEDSRSPDDEGSQTE